MLRTNTCGELTKKDIKKKVVLCGWLDSKREHGKICFINLRDRYGITQVVFDEKLLSKVHDLKNESVLKIDGIVRARPEGIVNKNIVTGEIEVEASNITVLNESDVLPLDMSGTVESTEETRFKYRYIDLRDPEKLNKLIVRHRAMIAAHEYMSSRGFLHIETPMLIKATPEGARDFIVPSRINRGTVYALPQSPQLYKQILMVAGVDRYYQFARCMRDEDLRADRQPEFTQIDIEMSFSGEEDVFELVEGLMKTMFKAGVNKDIKIPFERITYDESMARFGCDKPDMRFSMELIDVTQILKRSDFSIFKNAVMVKALIAPKIFSRKELDALTELVKVHKAKGLAYLKYEDNKFDGSIVKFLSENILKDLAKNTKIKNGETIFFVADKENIVNPSLSLLRNHLGKELKCYDEKEFKFAWVHKFPLFEFDEENNKWIAKHHMFTAPREEDIKFIDTDMSKVYGQLYDLVLNGVELCSGSVRIHDSSLQEKIITKLGLTKKDAELKFGFLIEAFKYGAPPHCGIAPGFDRTVAMMCGTNDIREVIAFPKNKKMESPMDGCPSKPDPEQLKELGMKFI